MAQGSCQGQLIQVDIKARTLFLVFANWMLTHMIHIWTLIPGIYTELRSKSIHQSRFASGTILEKYRQYDEQLLFWKMAMSNKQSCFAFKNAPAGGPPRQHIAFWINSGGGMIQADIHNYLFFRVPNPTREGKPSIHLSGQTQLYALL